MSNWLKDAGENVYEWWKKEKISGSIMPIFLVLNLLKFEDSGTNYTVTELIANGFMMAIMIYAIRQYYIRQSKEEALDRIHKENLKEIEEKYKVDMAKISHDTRVHMQKKQVEDFAMNIVKKEKERQYAMIAEQADFITEQIVHKTDHIVFITDNFDKADQFGSELINIHKAEIDNLRQYQKLLPHKLEMTFDDFAKGINEIPNTVISGHIVKTELDTVLGKVKDNAEIRSTIEEIEGKTQS